MDGILLGVHFSRRAAGHADIFTDGGLRLIPRERVELAAGDLVTLDSVWLGVEGAHIFDEAASDRRSALPSDLIGGSRALCPGVG